jgi:hypothetical protein
MDLFYPKQPIAGKAQNRMIARPLFHCITRWYSAIPKMELLGGIEGKRESNASPECGKTEGLC